MGIEYVFFFEKGIVIVGDVIIGVDFYICIYGVLGVFFIGVGLIDMGVGMVIGKCWFKVFGVIKFVLKNKLNKWISGKDIIFYIIGEIGVDGVFYKLMEFCGDGVEYLFMDDRFIICNMVIEVGVKNGIFLVDDKIMEYINLYKCLIMIKDVNIYEVDEDVVYDEVYEIDLVKLKEIVVFFYFFENIRIVDEIDKDIKID